jgi:hypothetical protein
MAGTITGQNCLTLRRLPGAVSAFANISKDVRARYQDRVLALNIRRPNGKIVLHVSLTLAVKWFPHDQVEIESSELAEVIQPPIPLCGEMRSRRSLRKIGNRRSPFTDEKQFNAALDNRNYVVRPFR